LNALPPRLLPETISNTLLFTHLNTILCDCCSSLTDIYFIQLDSRRRKTDSAPFRRGSSKRDCARSMTFESQTHGRRSSVRSRRRIAGRKERNQSVKKRSIALS